MNDFFKRLKLIDSMTTTLPMSKVEFINRLNNIIDVGSTGMLSDMFDVFSSGKNEFKGQVNFDSFKIKRKRKFFDSNMNFAVANGTFTENNGQLTIVTELNGLNNSFIFFYVSLLIIYAIIIFTFLFNANNGGFIVIPFILLHGAFMVGIPYFIMRRSVKRLKYELEREFFYLTKSK